MTKRPKEIFLSNRGLSSINPHFLLPDFEFVVGGNKYHCNKIIAGLLSPKVALAHRIDPTFNRMTIDISDEKHQFNKVLNIAIGNQISVDETDFYYYLKIGELLENQELIDAVANTGFPEIDINNSFSILIQKNRYGIDIFNEMMYCVRNYYQLNLSSILVDDIEIHEKVLSHNQLRVVSESQILAVVIMLMQRFGNKYGRLVKYVEFSRINKSLISKLLDTVQSEESSFEILKAIKRHFGHRPANFHQYIPKGQPINKMYDNFDGIIKYSKTLKIRPSSTKIGSIENLLDYDSSSSWCSDDSQTQFIVFDFTKSIVCITDYLIVANTVDKNLPITWNLECSNDGKEWMLIDEQIENTSLEHSRKVIFTTIVRTIGRYIRFTQTGKNLAGNDSIHIEGIELYGQYYEMDISQII